MSWVGGIGECCGVAYVADNGVADNGVQGGSVRSESKKQHASNVLKKYLGSLSWGGWHCFGQAYQKIFPSRRAFSSV